MKTLGRLADETLGLLVDDRRLALGIPIWLVATWALGQVAGRIWTGPILVIGLICLLLESVLRGARSGRR